MLGEDFLHKCIGNGCAIAVAEPSPYGYLAAVGHFHHLANENLRRRGILRGLGEMFLVDFLEGHFTLDEWCLFVIFATSKRYRDAKVI